MRIWTKKRPPYLNVEAEMLTADNVGELANWSQAQIVEEKDFDTDLPIDVLIIRGVTFSSRCFPGMYLVKTGLQFHAVTAEKFESLYNPAVVNQ